MAARFCPKNWAFARKILNCPSQGGLQPSQPPWLVRLCVTLLTDLTVTRRSFISAYVFISPICHISIPRGKEKIDMIDLTIASAFLFNLLFNTCRLITCSLYQMRAVVGGLWIIMMYWNASVLVKRYSSSWQVIPPGVIWRMRSHSVTFHPTQVNSPRLTPARQAGTRFTYPRGMEGWVDLGDLYIPRFTRPQMATHPSTNRAQCRLTTLIKLNALTTTLCRHLDKASIATAEI